MSSKRRDRQATFEAELVEGRQGVTVVLVPFDPEVVWDDKPVRLAGRRHGWPVRGTVNGSPFVGYVGERWGRFFLLIEPELREALGARVGDLLAVAVVPTRAASAVARAIEQSPAPRSRPAPARTPW